MDFYWKLLYRGSEGQISKLKLRRKNAEGFKSQASILFIQFVSVHRIPLLGSEGQKSLYEFTDDSPF